LGRKNYRDFSNFFFKLTSSRPKDTNIQKKSAPTTLGAKGFTLIGTKSASFLGAKGFTLIELVVVIAILAIVSTFAITAINPIEQYQKGQDSKRKTDLAQVQRALEAYYQDHGKYPSNTPDFKILDGATIYAWGSSWSPYINVLPSDSNSNKTFVYYTQSSDLQKQSYWLYASLDRGSKDSQACNSGNACSNVPNGATCGDVCNYGVSSSNTSP